MDKLPAANLGMYYPSNAFYFQQLNLANTLGSNTPEINLLLNI